MQARRSPAPAGAGTSDRRRPSAELAIRARRSSAAAPATSTLTTTRAGLTRTTCRKPYEGRPTTGPPARAKRRRRMATEKTARATWDGDLVHGSGNVKTGSGSADAGMTWSARAGRGVVWREGARRRAPPRRHASAAARNRGHNVLREGGRGVQADLGPAHGSRPGGRARRGGVSRCSRRCEGELSRLAGAQGKRGNLGRRVSGLVRAALDPPRGHLAEVATHAAVAGCGSLDVVVTAAELELAGPRADRPGGAPVTVERHADPAGGDERRSVRPGAVELLVAMSEADGPVANAGEHPRLVVLRLRREALDVRERRAVHEEHAVDLRLRRQCVQHLDLVLRQATQEELVRLHHLGAVVRDRK